MVELPISNIASLKHEAFFFITSRLKQSVEYAADAVRTTGEGSRQTVSAGVQSMGEFAKSAMDAVKDSSQAGLEKIGLATPEKSSWYQWEDGLQSPGC
ncbi:hypothetical protein R1flu_019230 [Riccia fluitans]|uniref:Uncharacterized protein n=1 Tax=Riccia fluitans TaxID=41844 RepID=A0ABD1ZIE2_9MARC